MPIDPLGCLLAREGGTEDAAEMTLQELVNQAAGLHSARKAVWFDECNGRPPAAHTYGSMVKLAGELTAFLQKHCEQQGQRGIGLYCSPGINLPSWILGILQVPAAYSPIDPDAPSMLSTHFMRRSNLQYVLVENDKVNKFQMSHAGWFCPSSSTVEHIGLTLFQRSSSSSDSNAQADSVRSDCQPVEATGDLQPALIPHPDQAQVSTAGGGYVDVGQECSLAYILHTSGTTGIPKIVRVPHKCIVPNIQHLQSLFEVTQDDVLFLASPLTFDPSVVELFVALASGASVLIVPNTIKMMPVELSAALFHHHHVTVLQATPTLLRRFGAPIIKSTVLSANTSLRVLALGGEAFPALQLLRSWKHKENRTSIFNLYGITEVSSWATCYKVPEEAFSADFRADLPVPLGSPLLGTRVEVRDGSGAAVLEGEGQVFIGGEERICFLDEERALPVGTMRATGDFVRVQGGELLFLGRKDDQVKRHGKRFSIQTLQQAAEGLHQVEACAVTWYQQEKLILFVVPRGDLEERETLQELQQRVPAYAVPDELVLVQALPLTLHGKVDVSELNRTYQQHLSCRRRGRKLSGTQELWARLQYSWQAVLGGLGDPTGIPKDAVFLDSGGDSLKALRLHEELELLAGRAVPGLLEAILSCSIEGVYRHILKILFPEEEQLMNCASAVKRKQRGKSGEELHSKHTKLEAGRGPQAAAESSPLLALSRGNHLLSRNFHKPLLQPRNAAQAGVELPQQAPSLHAVTPGTLQSPTEGSERAAGQAGGPDRRCAQHSRAAGVELCLRWKANTGKCVDASPLVVIPSAQAAAVYVGSHSHTMQAIDLESGERRWEKTLGDRIESSACVSKCGGFLVVGCYDGLVYVLQSSDGEVHWTFATEDAVKSSAVVDPSSGVAYIGSHDQHVYALDIYVTGSTLWKSSLGKPLFSSPHCNEQCVCVGCVDGNLYCYTHAGEKAWQLATGGPVFSSPCISSLTQQEVFVGSHDCFIYCCSTEGTLLWKFKATASVYGAPFVFQSDGPQSRVLLAAVSTDGRVWILNARSGRAEGAHKLPGEVFSSPVVWGTKLVVGCRNDYVYCLDVCTAGGKSS
ncbi:beta-alanine-activating enzyme isoform X2 [Melanerpes formicivorus]|uniref:beta-alanine-activating enzyme isoform X2 n=1 Tax=Melanerpes formicivorus TaxID=211600 RepID=UPI00358EA113